MVDTKYPTGTSNDDDDDDDVVKKSFFGLKELLLYLEKDKDKNGQ